MKGKFVTFEGCEGAGKSRQIALLEQHLKKTGVDYVLTREPGGSPVAEEIRRVILARENAEMTDVCEALLYAAARAQHLHDTVIPNLERGKLVICDRYLDSSYAYQAHARGLGMNYVRKINAFALQYLPDTTIFLDLPPALAFRRKGGADQADRVELAGRAFHERVYEGYLAVLKEAPGRIVPIDCSGSREETHRKIVDALVGRGILA